MPRSDNDELWGTTEDQEDYRKWEDMSIKERIIWIVVVLVKIIVVLGCLYLFICSLSVMGSSFQILAGKTTGYIFGETSILSNAIVGLITGILGTVLVQSSSTSTSIVTTMVGARIITVHNAIPVIMGANIGTSVTNTIVSLSQSMNADQFRRAFAGATVHDIFNLLTVLILLPIEVITGFLEKMTAAIVESALAPYRIVRNNTATNTTEVDFSANFEKTPDILKRILYGVMDLPPGKSATSATALLSEGSSEVITNPLTKNIVQVNKKAIQNLAKNDTGAEMESLIKRTCKMYPIPTPSSDLMANETEICKRKGVFGDSSISDEAVGAILLIMSLIILCVCLLTMVKVLQSLMKGGVAKVIKKVINSNFPKPFGWLTGYVAILVGAGMTIIVQSSSVFTSTITPLVGMGVISLKRMYPLTLGSNIGTTTTSVLAALTADGKDLPLTLQIAFSHFFFNITGILIWYPIPFMRHVPINGSKFLGRTTAKYRWFAVAYLLVVFFTIPAVIFGLSLIKPLWVMGSIMIVVAVIAVFIVVLKIIQAKKAEILPPVLRTWKFFPVGFRSLEPYDRVIMKLFGWCKCCSRKAKSNKQNEFDLMNAPEKEAPQEKITNDAAGYVNGGFEKGVVNESV